MPNLRSNAVHAAAFDLFESDPDWRAFFVYNPSSKPLEGVKFWNRKTGFLEYKFDPVPARMICINYYDKRTKEVDGGSYTPSLIPVPVDRLYLRKGDSGKAIDGLLDAKPAIQGPDETKAYPKDLSDSQLEASVLKLGLGQQEAAKFTGKFTGKLTEFFRYTQFSLFVNAALYPGWTRDVMRNDGAGVEVQIEYDFGPGPDRKPRKRIEFYGDPFKNVTDSKFGLEITNTWLNHNALTEYATTTVPLTRMPGQNPNKPYCEGVQFADVSEAKDATITVSIWKAKNALKNPDIYLSYNCPLSFERASWIRPPYE
jgi:hypothetical protein